MNFEEQPSSGTNDTNTDEHDQAAQKIIEDIVREHESAVEPRAQLSPEEKTAAKEAKKNLQKWSTRENYFFSEAYQKVDTYLLTKYGKDCRRYKMYHFLAGSTPPKSADLFDFPGEDSLVLFLERQANMTGEKSE